MSNENAEVIRTCKIDSNLLANYTKYNFYKGFDCTLEVINRYYQDNLKRALKSENVMGIGAVSEENNLIGFCTVTLCDLDKPRVRTFLPEGNVLPQVPVVKLAMLGVDSKYQGFGIGQKLLMKAFEQSLKVHSYIPIKGMFLDAAPGAVSFYESLGFEKLDDADDSGSTPMFLHIKYVKAAVQMSSTVAINS